MSTNSIPDVHSFDQIVKRARERAENYRPRAALLDIMDDGMLTAFARAAKEGLIDPILFCNPALLDEACERNNISFEKVQVIHADSPDMAVINATKLVFEQEVDLIVKGRIHTSDMLKVLFDLGSYFVSKQQVVSHVAILQPATYGKLLMLTDSAVIVQPDLKTKIALIQNLVQVAGAIGLRMPRVALLAAVEVIYQQMPVTMEAAIIAKMAERGQIKGAHVDGPLSFDVAVDPVAAAEKGVTTSEVAGRADAMVAPNIEVANGVYKGMALFCDCPAAGVVVGGRVPIAIGSRSDTAESKFSSIAIGVLTGHFER